MELLRLHHRAYRDHRITTHVALTARAMGISKMYYTGQKDSEMEKSIDSVTKRFGGKFKVEHLENYKPLIKNKKVVHLTMYGLPIEKEIKTIKKHKNILVIVGGAKVEPEFYKLGYNISVTQQPISEVSALAIFLYKYNNEKFSKDFKNAKLKIIPTRIGKLIKQ